MEQVGVHEWKVDGMALGEGQALAVGLAEVVVRSPLILPRRESPPLAQRRH